MHFACDFCTALDILAFILKEFVKGEKKTVKWLVFDRIKSESMGAPGRCATCYLSDFNETWSV